MHNRNSIWYAMGLVTVLVISAWAAPAAEAAAAPHASASPHLAYPPFDVEVSFDQGYHLPGDPATLFVSVINTTSGGLQYGVQTVTVTGLYTPTGKAEYSQSVPIDNHPTPSNFVSDPFTVPANASEGSYLEFTVAVNASTPTGTVLEDGGGDLYMATPYAPGLCAATTVAGSGCYSVFPPGASFYLDVHAEVETADGDAPWANQSVSIAFYLNGHPASPSGFPSSITTDTAGEASGVVETSGLGTGDLNITASISDQFNAALHVTTTIFVHINAVPTAIVDVQQSAAQYYGGSSAAATYTLATATGGTPTGWSVFAYEAILFTNGDCSYADAGGASPYYHIIAEGTSVTGTSGSVPTVPLPTTLSGNLDIVVFANNATASTYGESCATVDAPALLVTASEYTYNPGDTVSVQLSPEGSAFSGASYTAIVSGPGSGGGAVILYNSSLGSSTSFSFTIPKLGTLASYTISVVAQTSIGVISGQDVTITENSGYAFSVSLQTASAYSDGSFKPGQTITFGYTLTPLGTAGAPKVFEIETSPYLNSAQTSENVVYETSTSGTFSVTIPSSAGTGVSIYEFIAEVPGYNSPYAYFGVIVESNPSVLNYELFGAGTTFTVADLILLIVVLIGAILAILIFRHRKSGGMGGSKRTKKGAGVEQWSQQQAPPDQQPPPMAPMDQSPPPAYPDQGGYPGQYPGQYPPQYPPQ